MKMVAVLKVMQGREGTGGGGGCVVKVVML